MKQINTSNNFDVLRLVLSFMVFFTHWNFLTNQQLEFFIFHLGDYAVTMFFIVSGFLIFWSFDNDQNKKHFYIKRFFRIFPLYAFLIFLQTLFFVFYSTGSISELAKYFLSNIVFLNFLSPSVGSTLTELQQNAINGSLWTLKNEVVFYLLVPFIFALYKKWGVYSLVLLYVLSVIYMFLANYLDISKMLVLFPAQLRLFLTGILLYIYFNKIDTKNIYILAIISFISILIFHEYNYFKFIAYPPSLGILMLFLVYYVKYLKIKFDFSYSFYILHVPTIQLSLYFGFSPSNPILSFVILFCVVLILSYFSEKYIEKRFIQIGRNIVRRSKNVSN